MSLLLNDSEQIELFLEAVIASEEEQKEYKSLRIVDFLTKEQLNVVNYVCNLGIALIYLNFGFRFFWIGEEFLALIPTACCAAVSLGFFLFGYFKKDPVLTNTLSTYSLLILSVLLYSISTYIRLKMELRASDKYVDQLEYGFKTFPEGTKNALKESIKQELILGQVYVMMAITSFSCLFLFFLFHNQFSVVYSIISLFLCNVAGFLISTGSDELREITIACDMAAFVSLFCIVGSIKCYLFWMSRNILKKNHHLSKIKEFYQNWVTQSKISYILVKDKEMSYINEKNCSRNLLESLEIYESHSKNLAVGEKFSSFISKIEGSTSLIFETKAIVRQKNSESQERFFECLVKNYAVGYSEVILIDNTSIVKTEKKKVEQEYSNMLFAKIAHEFKTPLNNIQLLAEQLAEENDCKEVNMIQNLSRYMFYLVKDMSDYFQRGIRTQMDVVRKEVSLTEICKFCFEVAESLVSLNSDKKDFLKVKFQNLAGEVKIMGDQVRIQQVLLNLLSNSIKFTFSGEITLKLQKESRGYSVSVNDTGKGMSEEMLKRVLNLDGSLQIRSEYNEHGSGLGLSIVQDILKRMDFSFEIKTQIGIGTNVTISVPSDAEFIEGSETPTELWDKPMFFSPRLAYAVPREEDERADTIIVVDDNHLNRASMVRLLTKISKERGKEWNIVSLTDGAYLFGKILDLLRKRVKIRTVITDEYMEVMNGSTAVQILRQLEESNKIPAIKYLSYSSFENKNHAEKMINYGIDDVIPKPGTIQEVLQVFQRQSII